MDRALIHSCSVVQVISNLKVKQFSYGVINSNFISNVSGFLSDGSTQSFITEMIYVE